MTKLDLVNAAEIGGTMKIEWAPRAQRDLKAIFDYVAKERPSDAAQVRNQILRLVSFLADGSDIGHHERHTS
ncbi:MAG TPA: type II toxin-antitoxin system RelE/ParE family toxin [Terricaulis sp.]|nr:type II toxin-antitoxin system RelE/ParE family toxin [Terricaulis sp.]